MASPGDRPVFVMPGFLAGDGSTMPLRRTLDRLGHTTYGWDLGRNLGPTPEILDGIVEASTNSPSTARSMSSNGASSGIFARVGPGCAAHGQTGDRDGQPVPDRDAADSNTSLPTGRSDTSTPRDAGAGLCARRPPGADHLDLHRADGVVRWADCLNHDTETSENVEVYGSHADSASTSPHSSWWPTDSPNRSTR